MSYNNDYLWDANGSLDRIEAYFDYLNDSYFISLYSTVLGAATYSTASDALTGIWTDVDDTLTTIYTGA